MRINLFFLLFIFFFTMVLPTITWAKLKVVCTVGDLAAIAKQVGGKHVDINYLAHPLEDPHYVDARPNFIVMLSNADLLIENGLELEQAWVAPLIEDSRNPDLQDFQKGRFDASRFIKALEVLPQVDRSQGDMHAQGNPHYTQDPRRMLSIIDALVQRLSLLDPVHQKDFVQTGTQAKSDIQKWMLNTQKRFAQIPAEKKLMVTYHRSYSYLANWLHINIPIYAEPKPGIPPSPSHLARVLGLAKNLKIKTFLQESYYPQRTLKVMSTLAKGKHIIIEGQTRIDESETYIQHMQTIVDALYQSLK